jgi:hypothetical protein
MSMPIIRLFQADVQTSTCVNLENAAFTQTSFKNSALVCRHKLSTDLVMMLDRFFLGSRFDMATTTNLLNKIRKLKFAIFAPLNSVLLLKSIETTNHKQKRLISTK